ncbi:MAG: methyltransferase [Candidatus Methylomirabilia bacterium]
MAEDESSKPDHPSERRPQEVILSMAFGYLPSRAIFVAAELGIADLLRRGAKSIEELAVATGTYTDSLYRLLRMLASHGIFAEDEQGRFHVTPLAAALESGVPGSVRDAVRMVDGPTWNSCGNLLHAVKSGTPAFDAAFGMGFFDYLAMHPEASARFDASMANFSEGENSIIAAAYDFNRFKQIVDVGGGRGGFIAEVLKAHPSPTGILYDRPEVVVEPTYPRAAGVIERCKVIGGNFWESVPRGGDAYILKRILHDWRDDQAIAILRLCRDAMSDHGRVLTIDAVIPPGNEAHPSKDSDIFMMAMVPGRERSETEFRALYQNAGLKLTNIVPTRSALCIVEGKRE